MSPVSGVDTDRLQIVGQEARGRRLGMPLAIALAVVAVLAGSGLFLSGYSIGRSAATTPGTPAAETESFQAFWDAYHAVTDRYAGGPSTARSSSRARSRGWSPRSTTRTAST